MSKRHKQPSNRGGRLKSVPATTKIVDPARKPVNTPAISFQYICQDKFCIKLCSHDQYRSLSDKLRIICNLDWNVIDSAPRTTHGYEKMPRKQLRATVPSQIPADSEILVFRFGSGDHVGRLVGCRLGKRLYLLFVESTLNSLYNHGS